MIAPLFDGLPRRGRGALPIAGYNAASGYFPLDAKGDMRTSELHSSRDAAGAAGGASAR